MDMNLANKVKTCLNIIEKKKGDFNDDTYIDKFILGIEKKLQLLSDNEVDEFVKQSELQTFCEKNMFSENNALQEISLRMIFVICNRSSEHVSKWAYEILKMNLWPVTTNFFGLLEIMIKHKKVEYPIVWTKILAQIILTKQDKSHFWKDAAMNLCKTYFLHLILDFQSLEKAFIERINQVLKENLQHNRYLYEAVIHVYKTLDIQEHKMSLEKVFSEEHSLPLEAKVIWKMKTGKDASNLLLNHDDKREFISCAKTFFDNGTSEELETKIIELVEKDYKVISNFIKCKPLAPTLWNLIFSHYLTSFVVIEDGEVPSRDLNTPSDVKILLSCLSSIKNLIPQIHEISQSHWSLLVKISMIPEMTPITRSTLIDVMKSLIENDKFAITLEALASQLWHLLRYQDWETRDAILYCFSLPQLSSDSESVPKALIGLMKSSLASESSFVRKASLIFLEKLWTIEKDLIEDVHTKIEKILQNETEAIVRRQSVEFVVQCLYQNGPTNDLMMLASKDLDWEVKSVSLRYWCKHLDAILEDDEVKDFDQMVDLLNKTRILEGLQLITKDYEKSLQNDCFQYLKGFKKKLEKKFPKATMKENMLNVSSTKKMRMQEEFLIDILHEFDYDSKEESYKAYCENHYGFSSVCQDIMQSDITASDIDTIDCF